MLDVEELRQTLHLAAPDFPEIALLMRGQEFTAITSLHPLQQSDLLVEKLLNSSVGTSHMRGMYFTIINQFGMKLLKFHFILKLAHQNLLTQPF